MRVAINEKNKSKIQKELDELQKRCKMRCVSYGEIALKAKQEVERVKRAGGHKKDMDGLVVSYLPSAVESFPSAYEYEAKGTGFVIEYGRGGQPYLTRVYRDDARRSRSIREVKVFPDGLKESLLKGFKELKY